MAALIPAYASPALVAPPALDQGARAALEALAANGTLLAVISNTMRTPGAVVRQILDQAGLLPLFRVLTFSDECGIRKPARAIFLRTLEELGVAAEHAAHVGDDAILDVEGARDAGMAAVQGTAHGRATPPMQPPPAPPHPAPHPLRGRRPGHRGGHPVERAGGKRRAPGGPAAVRAPADLGAGRELRRVGGPAGARRVRSRGRS